MKKATMFVLAAALTISMTGCGSSQKETEAPKTEAATEAKTEAKTEAATEKVTEAKTEAATEKATEAETEAKTEAVTEKATEAETEAATEKATEAETEAKTEAATEKETEAKTEAVTEKATETETEKVTEAESEVETETEKATDAESERETEVETETETEKVTEKGIEKATEAETEAATEAKTEKATEAETETEKVTEAATEAGTEEETEEATEKATEPVEVQTESEAFEAPEGTHYKAALLLNGNLGDKSFYDSANEGLERLRDELGEDVFDFKVEQMGGTAADEAKWEPTLLDYCDTGAYDVIIMGTWQMADALARAAEEYPDQKFIFFDEEFDFEGNGNPENVYNVMYKQNEVSYLVGAAAAMMTTDDSIEGIDPDNHIIGFLGGMDNSVINDFLVGYIQGAADIDPDIEVAVGFVGDFVDSTKGKDIALSQYQSGADVGFNVAGNAGLGQIEAAKDEGKYAFGVDSDQAALLPDYADYIPTSALKNVGQSLYLAIQKDMLGELKYGTEETYGFKEGGVALVKDAHYEKMLPENIRTKLDELEQSIIDGDIVVNTSADMDQAAIEALKESVKVGR